MQRRRFVTCPRMHTSLKVKGTWPQTAIGVILRRMRGHVVRENIMAVNSRAQRAPTFIVRVPNGKREDGVTCSIHRTPRGGLSSRQCIPEEYPQVEMEHRVDGWRAVERALAQPVTTELARSYPHRKEPEQGVSVLACYKNDSPSFIRS